MIPFCMFLIFFPSHALDLVFNAFMSYYYLTLMIREHILKVRAYFFAVNLFSPMVSIRLSSFLDVDLSVDFRFVDCVVVCR